MPASTASVLPLRPAPLSPPPVDEQGVLTRLMRARQLHAVFQPIADLRTGGIFGYEALIRGPAGTPLQSPDALLGLAARCGRLPEFELFCVETALADWRRSGTTGRLFVNLAADALVHALHHHGRDALVARLQAHRCDPRTLVVEITEHTRATDIAALREAAQQLRSSGIALALDDFGSDHSNLRMWSELRPDIVKIDKFFVRSPGSADGGSGHLEHLQILQAIKSIADVFGTTLVAEGIETAEDLQVLRTLRIPYGQGYWLGRPAPRPALQVEAPARQLLEAREPADMPPAAGTRPGVLRHLNVIAAPVVGLTTTNNALADIFHERTDLHAVAVVSEDRPVAVINRQQFMNHYATLYFREVHGRKPCIAYANHAPRVVERDYDVDDLIGILTSQDQRYLSDGFIVTEGGRYIGLGTGDQLVRTVSEARIEAARHANPLTFLPGNIPINLQIERLLDRGAEFVACHADLNDFKPFNDCYGYWRGDEMIRLAARLVVQHCDARHDFVGHVGGDDFMLLFQSSDWQARCERIVDEFAQQALPLFDPAARAAGGIHAEDRQGLPRFFPCTTLSIGAVRVRRGVFRHADAVASAAALAKHDAKRLRVGVHIHEPQGCRPARA